MSFISAAALRGPPVYRVAIKKWLREIKGNSKIKSKKKQKWAEVRMIQIFLLSLVVSLEQYKTEINIAFNINCVTWKRFFPLIKRINVNRKVIKRFGRHHNEKIFLRKNILNSFLEI